MPQNVKVLISFPPHCHVDRHEKWCNCKNFSCHHKHTKSLYYLEFLKMNLQITYVKTCRRLLERRNHLNCQVKHTEFGCISTRYRSTPKVESSLDKTLFQLPAISSDNLALLHLSACIWGPNRASMCLTTKIVTILSFSIE